MNGVNLCDMHVNKLTLYCLIYAIYPLLLSCPEGLIPLQLTLSLNYETKKSNKCFGMLLDLTILMESRRSKKPFFVLNLER